MKKIMKKGKSLISLMTVFAIIAVSVFTGAVVSVGAESCGGTISVFEKEEKELTLLDPSQPNSESNPYIISSANQMYNFMVGNSTFGGVQIDTTDKYFKVADGISAFIMNGNVSVMQLDSPSAVKTYFEANPGKQVWSSADRAFKGHFDGNGVTVYGIYSHKDGIAGLIPYIGGNPTIKNIAVKNSYLVGKQGAGGIVGSGYNTDAKTVTLDSCVSANNYIETSRTDCGAGGLVGYLYNAAGTVPTSLNNCLVYGNDIVSTTGKPCSAIGGSFNASANSFKNSVFLGMAPTLNPAGYHTNHNSKYSNCYTDKEITAWDQWAVFNDNQLKQVSATTGLDVVASMPNLDWENVWFANDGVPALRVFHNIETVNNGDGTHSEACDCGLEGKSQLHTFVDGVCSGCMFINPCVSGHTFEAVEEVPATKTQNGIKAHEYCSVCGDKFIDGAVVMDSDLIIPMLVSTSEYTGNLDADLLGSGTKKDPYLITSADEFAAVALGKVQADQNTYFKVLESLTAFYMNGGELVAEMTNANDVKAYFEANGGKDWTAVSTFSGQFDGSGVTVYGLYVKNSNQYALTGLFPKIAGHSGIKNIAIKNSYISGYSKDGATAALVGGGVWINDNTADDTSVAIQNVAVVNNYIASTNDTTAKGASVLIGNLYNKNYATVDNCLMYGNLVENAYTGAGLKSGMITEYSGVAANTSFNNIIAVGVTPWTVADNGDGTYAHSGWYLSNLDTGHFKNIYTDMSKDILQAYNPTNNSDSRLNSFNIKTSLTAEQLTGAAAKGNITSLDEDIWFFNTTTYPQIRVFHELTADAKGVDGHENEKDVCCGLEIIREGLIPHTYEGDSCSICGYEFPCSNGHDFTDVEAKDASYDEAGNIAHKYCAQCDKKYPSDAAIDEPVTSAYSDSDVIIPQMRPYDEWDGTYASYFWMNNEGDGSAATPFIIHSAEQLAAVATGNLKYDANKPTSAEFDISKYTLSGTTLDTTGLNFKIRDGLNYLYINGGEDLAKLDSAEKVKEYFETNGGKKWLAANIFNGNFNGNGAEIYGVYNDDSTTVGLFPLVDSKVQLKNVVLKNSYFKTSAGNANNIAAGGLLGRAQWYQDSTRFGTLTVRACVVANNYICSQSEDASYGRAGAIAGGLYSNSISIRDTLVYGNIVINGSGIDEKYEAGLVAFAGGGNTIYKNIVSIDTVPYTAGGGWHLYDNSKFTNVYTDGAITIADGATVDYKSITKLTKEQMTGESAKDNMPALDWVQFWMTNDGEYPTPRVVNIKDYSSGLAWTGEVAKEFPSGDGSKASPYTIPAPEYLALMLTTDNDGLYYKLTADIIINDTTDENWTKTAKAWYTSEDVANFKGTLDGNGFTVSGLYYGDVDAGVSAGLIPVADSATVVNLTVENSYLSSITNSNLGAVIGSVPNGCAKPITIQGITIEDTVVIEGTDAANIAGIIGKAGDSVIRITNSISKSSGLIDVSSNGVSIKNSVSVDAAPVAVDNGVQFKNVYTNTQFTADGVTVLSSDAMKGDEAAANMPGLDFENVWKTVSDDYVAIDGVINANNGTVGEAWSGNVATAYAGGDGTAENPYLIATAEQLARCVASHAHGKHYKLVADIYLNDVNSQYWDLKVGCLEWYTSKNASWGLFKNNGSFDGDGYVVYGLYYERTGYFELGMGAYLGLFPTVSQKALIQNVAISQAYVAGSMEYYSQDGQYFSDSAGALIGMVTNWDSGLSHKSELPSTSEAKKMILKPEIWDYMPIIKNVLVDHTCYIQGTYAGGIFGYCNEPFRAYDCIFTGSLKGMEYQNTGGIAGQDTANGAYYVNCVSLPQTCDRPYGGWANSDWRTIETQWPTTVIDGYYFSKYNRVNSGEKIANPSDRVGEAAKTAMPLLDWENTWMVIEDGTPIQQIFMKHRTLEEATELSDREFKAPYVTVSFFTNDENVVVESMVGRMYEPITLPVVEREGYKFTGWYAFDDCSMLYPLDYFPPRDLQLYAGWQLDGIAQNFEEYPDTIFDYDGDSYRLNKPGAKGGYKNKYVRNGGKSMHLLDTNTDFADFLINYEDMLKIGQTYTMTFWVTTDKADNPDTILKLVHNEYPEYSKSNAGVEEMLTVTGLTVGEWTQYSYEFTARTPWISIRAGAGSSLYFDDMIISETGETISNEKLANYLANLDEDGGKVENTDNSTVSPDTSENMTVTVLISVILSCAVIVIISKKNFVEVIEN